MSIFFPMVANPPQIKRETWDPARSGSSIVLSNANLTCTCTSSLGTVASRQSRGTVARAVGSGKFYFEVTLGSPLGSGTPYIGVGQDPSIGGTTGNWIVTMPSDNSTRGDGSYKSQGTTYAAGDRVNVACDLGTNSIWFGKNGTYILSGNPSAGTNATWTTLSGTLYPLFQGQNADSATINFGPTFVDTVPTGFAAW